jgi:dolichol kinase
VIGSGRDPHARPRPERKEPGSADAKPPVSDPLAPFRSRSWLNEAQRKAIHISSIGLPLMMLYEWLPWPRGRAQWGWVLLALVVAAIVLDILRIHGRPVRRFFREFFGQMIREHERFNLLGSTYLLLAALLAVEIFPWPVAGAALGFTVLGDSMAALVGRAWGRHRFFNKTLEGAAGGLVACLGWAAFLIAGGFLSWPVALTGALAASLIEILPIPLDDNLGVTLFSGYVMRLLGGAA